MKNKQTIPELTKKQFDELVDGKKLYRIRLDKITNKKSLMEAMVYGKCPEYGDIHVFTKSIKSFVDTVNNFLIEDICAKDTHISNFPMNEWVNCWIGDPFIKELSLIGKYNDIFILKTKEGDIITNFNIYENLSYIQPAP